MSFGFKNGTLNLAATTYAPLCGPTSSPGAAQSASTGMSTSGFVLTSTGSGSLPTFQSVSAAGAVTTITGNSGGAESPSAGNFNILGTGSITIAGSANTETVQLTGLTNHAIQIGAGTATLTQLAATATTGQVLQNNSGADPSYSTATYPSTTTINQILYSSSANVIGGLATANNGVLITSATGVPSLLPDGTTGQVLTATTGAPPSWASPASSGTVTTVSVVSANGFAGTVANASSTPAITLSTTITGVLSGNGTAISGSAITQFDVLVGGATNAISSVGPGTAGQILQSGGNAANPAYSTSTYPSTNAVNTLLYASSANVMAALATANNGVLITSNAGVPSILAETATAGIPLVSGGTGVPPAFTTAVVAGGGTGDVSFTAYAVICGGTTSTGALQSIAGVGTTGQVLTSNGAGALPTFQAAASSNLTITSINHASSPYTVLAADQFIKADCSGGVISVLLPNAPSTGRVIYIKDSTGSSPTSNISVTTVGGTVTIDGSTTYTMSLAYQNLGVIFDGSNYEAL